MHGAFQNDNSLRGVGMATYTAKITGKTQADGAQTIAMNQSYSLHAIHVRVYLTATGANTTPTGGTFTGGVVRAKVWYSAVGNIADAA